MSMTTERTSLRDRTVGEIAATLPGATGVFRKLKLDFCCGGDVPLEEAAQRRGLNIAAVESELFALDRSDKAPASEATPGLIRHIIECYHETHRRELPELIKLARKVEAVHAEHPQAPRGLADTLKEMVGELELHMKKEELILFPAMARRTASCLDELINEMRHDHDDQGAHLRRLEAITRGYALPEDACRSWQALYAGAVKFVDDLAEHIHLENNVLFPRFEKSQAP